MKRMQQGFTLIELMIVVAIVAILAAVALPAYKDYTVRAKITEGMVAASACKNSVAEFIQSNNAFPANADAAGCSTSPSKYVSGVAVANLGIVTVTLQGTGAAGADTKTIVLQPTTDATRKTALAAASDVIQGWSCGTNANAADYKYFPAPCRQAVLGGI